MVIFTLVISTIVARGPIIFLKLAEAAEGEIDGVITATSSTINGIGLGVNSGEMFINLTRIEEVYPGKYRLSPRKTFCGTKMGSDHTNRAILDADDETEMKNWRS